MHRGKIKLELKWEPRWNALYFTWNEKYTYNNFDKASRKNPSTILAFSSVPLIIYFFQKKNCVSSTKVQIISMFYIKIKNKTGLVGIYQINK